MLFLGRDILHERRGILAEALRGITNPAEIADLEQWATVAEDSAVSILGSDLRDIQIVFWVPKTTAPIRLEDVI